VGWTELDQATRTELQEELKAHGDILYLNAKRVTARAP